MGENAEIAAELDEAAEKMPGNSMRPAVLVNLYG